MKFVPLNRHIIVRKIEEVDEEKKDMDQTEGGLYIPLTAIKERSVYSSAEKGEVIAVYEESEGVKPSVEIGNVVYFPLGCGNLIDEKEGIIALDENQLFACER